MRLVGYSKNKTVYKTSLLLLASSILLVGCKEEEVIIPPAPPAEVVPVTYDLMKVKRDNFNEELYFNAQEQQYVEIERPYLEELITKIEGKDLELEEGLEHSVVLQMRFDETFDNSEWLQGIQKDYQAYRDDLTDNFYDTHPDATDAQKNAYHNITNHLQSKLDLRISQIQTIITLQGVKGTNTYSPAKLGADTTLLKTQVENNHDLLSVFKVYNEAILRYFEKDREDETLPPL